MQAAENGFLRRLPDGSFVEASGSPENSAQNPNPFEAMKADEPEQQSPTDERSFDATTEATVAYLNDHVPPQVIATAVEDVVNGEGISLQAVHDVAKSLNIAPADLQARISSVYDAYERQAYTAVESVGVVPGEGAEMAFEWMRQNRPQELQAAIRRHIGERDVSGYRELARDFLRTVRGQR